MKKISVKLAVAFIILILLSSLLSFLTSAVYMPNLQQEIKESQEAIGILIKDLSEKTDLSNEEISDIISWYTYETSILTHEEEAYINEQEYLILLDGGMIHKPFRRFSGVSTYLMIDDDIMRIQLRQNQNIWKIAASRIWFPGISFVIIGSVLIIFVVRHAVRPIIKLTNATREITLGNFDVEINYNNKDEIGQLTTNFNRMINELKKIDTLRKDFVSNVSHEFKTPIASIQGFAQLLQQDDLSDENRKEYARIISEESSRLSHLTSSMLKLSKLENQEIIQKHKGFYLDEQIRKCILLLEPEWSKKSIDWEINLDRAMITADEELLQQVWINLLINAIKFSSNDGKIIVSLNHLKEGVEISIRDFGKGMSSKTKERIFEKFYQGEEAHDVEGSGLGLSLVKRILDLHGAQINVESSLGEGSEFSVTLNIN
ncbi:signal transduction histidine kinase [Acetoanaerobium pronyense]|uniref:Heme sensor protein HssS n=1 Tax=Acetoanaerobium pronyense TaxID=1482736 RepID=A0ABS4KH67_9FIRM|nr:HAMP domain-containing sensor histidine kinase [Acetoanaerobium pronyense]MBP2026476.1 signal transduction histidine kinase [Acetoanaerobium pronyense]